MVRIEKRNIAAVPVVAGFFNLEPFDAKKPTYRTGKGWP
jgi:hypothetical protein